MLRLPMAKGRALATRATELLLGCATPEGKGTAVATIVPHAWYWTQVERLWIGPGELRVRASSAVEVRQQILDSRADVGGAWNPHHRHLGSNRLTCSTTIGNMTC